MRKRYKSSKIKNKKKKKIDGGSLKRLRSLLSLDLASEMKNSIVGISSD